MYQQKLERCFSRAAITLPPDMVGWVGIGPTPRLFNRCNPSRAFDTW